ncbi:hypothetical protein NDU88_004313 [Pleurodeles waltl]|uniref:Uncharacterized protein n=1 Tax=Pleurodeles waltl TaxID=8319 RepID=A0AAV7UIR9_PLEWA|nr:hypothetical protein NDU88_004313 [Pleurodeles waltl]
MFKTDHAGKARTVLVTRRKMVTGGTWEAATERRSHSQEIGERGDKEKRCDQETLSHWLKGASHNSTTVRHSHSKRNRSQEMEIRKHLETEEGEDAPEPAMF